MFKKLALILSIMPATSCGISSAGEIDRALIDNLSINTLIEEVDTPKDIRHHFVEFIYSCENTERAPTCRYNLRSLKSIKHVDNMQDSTIGTCWVCPNGNRYVHLSKNYTNTNSMKMKALVYHELGHCLMDLSHKPGRNIMSPNLVDPETYQLHWHNMLNEFYEQIPNKTYLDEEKGATGLVTSGDPNDPC